MAVKRDIHHRPHLCVVRDTGQAKTIAPTADERDDTCHCDQIPILVEALMQQRVEIAQLRARLLCQLENQEGPAS
ncbi:MAG TPA: hypothetical protein PKY96_18415 [Flavobacteriales bacterium]|nr:hypothetical protein [Flavobacteriales bacterium]